LTGPKLKLTDVNLKFTKPLKSTSAERAQLVVYFAPGRTISDYNTINLLTKIMKFVPSVPLSLDTMLGTKL
jgi:hypothetical protein